MHLKVIALDLDGTIAENNVVALETWATLRKAKREGFTLILVTGRRMVEISTIGPFDEICEAIVAEDGAAIYFPRNDTIMLPFGRLASNVIEQLTALHIPMEQGLAIAATWQPHDRKVLEVLSKTAYAATLEYNKGAVMIMPPGATKGTGLLIALNELGFSPHNVVAFGDAENDRSLFEQAELSVAVANTAPEIKAIADVELVLPNGTGVRTLVEELIQKKIPRHAVRPKQFIRIGQSANEMPIGLSPFDLIDSNLGIFGESGSGKSWIAGMLAEALLQQEYQVCIIDPEGDYRGIRSFPHTLLLGGGKAPPPSVEDVIILMEYSGISLILDLSLYSISEQMTYVTNLMHALCSLRQRRGKPHWFLIDEGHYFCPDDHHPLTKLLLRYMQQGGLALVSYRPSLIAPELLRITRNWLLTRVKHPSELAVIRAQFGGDQCPENVLKQIENLNAREVFLRLEETIQKDPPTCGIVELHNTHRLVTHVRHLHKYLRAPLPVDKRFYFKVNEAYKGPLTAASLWQFSEVIPQLTPETLQYHLERNDFEKWVKDTLHDAELARRLHKIANRKLEGDLLRDVLAATVTARFNELESLI